MVKNINTVEFKCGYIGTQYTVTTFYRIKNFHKLKKIFINIALYVNYASTKEFFIKRQKCIVRLLVY